MFRRYAEDAKKTIQFARDEAARFGASEIGTEHILLGLLKDAYLVNNAPIPGASLREIHDEVSTYLLVSNMKLLPSEAPVSKEAKETLVLARQEARGYSRRYVTNYDILLALMQMEECFAAQVLRRRGLSLDNIRVQMADLSDAKEKYPQDTQGGAAVETPSIERDLEDLLSLAIELSLLDDHAGVLKLVNDAISDPRIDRNQAILKLVPVAIVVARTTGDLDSALRNYELLVTCDPNNATALYGLACCLKERGRTDEANDVARKSYRVSAAQGDEIGRSLVQMIEKRFPEAKSGI